MTRILKRTERAYVHRRRLRRAGRAALACAVFALVAATAARGGDAAPGTDDPGFERAAAMEAAAWSTLFENLERWDSEKSREMAQAISDMPEPVASEALRLAASAPRRADAMRVFVAALGAPSPRLRGRAAALLILRGTADARRLVSNRFAAEGDPDVIRFIIGALASRPTLEAVNNLMEIMLMPVVKPVAAEAAGEHLRRLTRTRLSDNPADWRDWWMDNAHLYK